VKECGERMQGGERKGQSTEENQTSKDTKKLRLLWNAGRGDTEDNGEEQNRVRDYTGDNGGNLICKATEKMKLWSP
jgi:hypothetical protein